MKNIILIRHAKSDQGGGIYRDLERPLNFRGEKSLELLALLIDCLPIKIDRIFTSNAKRALDTASGISEKFIYKIKIETNPSIYLASCGSLIKIVRAISQNLKNVILIGHNPGLELFMDLLCGYQKGSTIMKTSHLSWLELNINKWEELNDSSASVKALVPNILIKNITNKYHHYIKKK